MPSQDQDIAVAVYDDHSTAEEVVKTLQRAGFDMKKISIVGKDYETDEHVIGFLNAGDRAKLFGKLGAFWGGLFGMLFGSALIFIPVIGPVVVLGPLAATIVGMIEGAVEGAVVVGALSALGGALSAVGIPKDSVLQYESELKANKYLVFLTGDAAEIERAREVLKASGVRSFDHHVGSDEATPAVTA